MKIGLPAAFAHSVLTLVLVLLAVSGGVPAKAQNGGTEEWKLLAFEDVGVTSIGFSPNYSTDRTIFVGTHDGSATTVHRSTDGGESWDSAPGWTGAVRAIVLSPDYTIDRTVFASTTRAAGIRRSTDGGNSWIDVGPIGEPVFSMQISPDYANDQTVFVGAYSGHVFRSVDGGDTWVDLGLILSGGYAARALAISPNYANDQTIFVGMGKSWDWYNGGVYRSIDGGNAWSPVNNGLSYKEVWALAISPNYAVDQTVLVTVWHGAIHRSTNGGNSWVEANNGQPNRRPGNGPTLAFSPDYAIDQTVFYGAWGETYDGGVYRSTDGTASWTRLNEGLSNQFIGALAVPPDYSINPKLLAGGELTNGGGLWVYSGPEIQPEIDYFALGNSIASGHGLIGDDQLDCRRSTKAYPYKVKALLETRYSQVNFYHLACSGAVALEPEDPLPPDQKYKWLHYQIEDTLALIDDEQPTLISITIGANDYNWLTLGAVMRLWNQPSKQYIKWADRRAESVGDQLREDVVALLEHPNVAVVVTGLYNPFNQESWLFQVPHGRTCEERWGFAGCYEKTELAVDLLNGSFVEHVWMELSESQRERVWIATGVKAWFAEHPSPAPDCGTADVPAGTWIQYPSDPASVSWPVDIPDWLIGVSGVTVWLGDCFHLNEAGAELYADEINDGAFAMGW